MRIRCKIFLGKGRKCIQKSCDRTKDLKEAKMTLEILLRIPDGSDGKKIICPQCRRLGFNPWLVKIPQRREWLPTPLFLPGECHGQRSLAGYSPQDRKESQLNTLLRHLITSRTLERFQKDLSKRK